MRFAHRRRPGGAAPVIHGGREHVSPLRQPDGHRGRAGQPVRPLRLLRSGIDVQPDPHREPGRRPIIRHHVPAGRALRVRHRQRCLHEPGPCVPDDLHRACPRWTAADDGSVRRRRTAPYRSRRAVARSSPDGGGSAAGDRRLSLVWCRRRPVLGGRTRAGAVPPGSRRRSVPSGGVLRCARQHLRRAQRHRDRPRGTEFDVRRGSRRRSGRGSASTVTRRSGR